MYKNGSPPRLAMAEDAGRKDVRQELRTYLAGFGWQGGDLDGLVERCLSGLRPCDTSAHEPAGLVLLEAELEAWSRRIFGDQAVAGAAPLLLARAAFRRCEGPRRWPECFMEDELPESFVAAMRAAAPEPTPPEDGGVMPAQTFEFWSLPGLAPAAGLPGRWVPVEERAAASALARPVERRTRP